MSRLSLITNGFIALYFSLLLTLTGGQNLPILLAPIALGVLFYAFKKREPLQISTDEKWLLVSFLFYFAGFVLSVIIHGDKTRILDGPSRIFLFIPLLFLFIKVPIRFQVLAWSVPIGSILSGFFALYQRFGLGLDAAFKQIFQIHGGGIAMTLAMFSLVLTFVGLQKKAWSYSAVCLLGTIMAMLGSFLSTARGAWIGLPFVLGLILFFFRQSISTKVKLGLCTGLVTVVFAFASLPQTQIMKRFDEGVSNLQNYQIGKTDSSLGNRLDMWKAAFLIAKEQPIFGIGQKEVIPFKMRLAEQGIITQTAASFGHQHNQFLDDLSKRGIVGLFALLGILFIPLRFFQKHLINESETRTLAILGVVHTLSFIFYCLSQSYFSHNSGTMYYFFFTILLYSMILAKEKMKSQKG